MRYSGDVYRPPSEANRLIRQIDAALAGKQPFRKYVELGF